MTGKTIKLNELQDFDVGESVNTDIVVRELKSIDTSGKNYSQTIVIVEDRTGRHSFPIWRDIGSVSLDMVEGTMYNLVGTTSKFRDEIQIKFLSSSIIEDTPENRKRIDPSFSRGITPENEKVLHLIIDTKFDDVRYKRFAEIALGIGNIPEGISENEYRARYERFKTAWCSVNHHDCYAGGLWNHVVGMLRVTLALRKIYSPPQGRHETISDVHWDHIMLLCILHDIEKPSEHIIDGHKCYYNPESLTNHIIKGASRVDILNNEIEEEYKLSFRELEKLRYGILCHHGSYGLYELKSVEDRIFHAIDMLDAANVDALRLE